MYTHLGQEWKFCCERVEVIERSWNQLLSNFKLFQATKSLLTTYITTFLPGTPDQQAKKINNAR